MRFEKSMLLANVVIAACAVIALWFTISQNRGISDALNSARDAFNTQAFPVVGFDSYGWVASQGATKLDCEHPPIGINIIVKNFSVAPVVDAKVGITLHVGEKTLDVQPVKTVGVDPKLLTAYESTHLQYTNEVSTSKENGTTVSAGPFKFG